LIIKDPVWDGVYGGVQWHDVQDYVAPQLTIVHLGECGFEVAQQPDSITPDTLCNALLPAPARLPTFSVQRVLTLIL
jgi:hypothetical protein